MRVNTQLGKVVSSHSSAWGASSLVAKLRIDSRSCSCSSVKMKCLRFAPKSGFRTFCSAVAIRVSLVSIGSKVDSRHFLLSACHPEDGEVEQPRSRHYPRGTCNIRLLA